MPKKTARNKKSKKTKLITGACLFLVAGALVGVSYYVVPSLVTEHYVLGLSQNIASTVEAAPPPPQLDRDLYDQKMEQLANKPTVLIASTSTSTPVVATSSIPTLWPVKTVYPDYGALLPFNRIVAYYGNFASKNLGVLGEYPPQQMLSMLMGVVAEWQAADPRTPVIPALDYIAVTAQGGPGPNGLYNARMPADQIQEAIDLANQVHGIVFLDIQVGLSNLQTEVPLLEPFLKLPNVELAVDPEFSMKTGKPPGTVIGSLDASDINFAANYLATIVDENNLPPKILVVHRFTEDMVTNSDQIQPLPEVQVVMDMDGWGYPAEKIKTYKDVIYDYPVQFTGFKLFYKNDLWPPSTAMLTPAQILNLTPEPSYIQYQ